MRFAFIDESGDNGARGSRHLTLAFICTSDRKELSKIIRDAKKKIAGQ